MSGIAAQDLRERVIRPVVVYLGLDGEAAEELLLGTAMQESRLGARLVQAGGPAMGVWQMEPATHDDIWANFLAYRAPLANKISTLLFSGMPKVTQLIGNLYYACAMARVDFERAPEALPAAGDLEAQAAYYKRYYNSGLGKASVDEYLVNGKKVGLGGVA